MLKAGLFPRITPGKDSGFPWFLARMFHEADFAGSFLLRWLHFVDLAQV
jgi:hypothetical protein